MITPYDASRVAHAMATIATSLLGAAYRDEFKAKNAYVTAKAGKGNSTYHRAQNGNHKLTFGPGMVAEKANGNGAAWLSAREIKRYRFYNGDQSVSSLLAHTILHEFAHAIQTLRGERLRGSVHNPAFYRILTDLHAKHGEDVRTSLRGTLERLGIDVDSVRTQKPTTQAAVKPASHGRDFQIGNAVRFEISGTIALGRIVRINPKSLTVHGTENGIPMKYRVSSSLVTKLNEGEYLKALQDRAIARDRAPTPTLIETPPPKGAGFAVGDKVKFPFKGQQVEGRVVRINRKSISVDSDNGRGYRVPPRLLRVA
ncbi:hypothetical protein [Marinobacter sp.]|uniref:hypothetical protein n=1 Tax=Marinobacter sp. TaxID=50741 RepID=UPI00356A72BA